MGQTTDRSHDGNDRLLVESLDRDGDGTVDQTTAYGYIGTQQASQEVRAGGVLTSRTTFGYDLQGRLATVTAETVGAGGTLTRRERTTYAYDGNGIRVADEHAVDAESDGTFETGTRTAYLNDPQNPTGYSQVLRATTTDLGTGRVQRLVVYTLGRDVISQTTTESMGGQAGVPTTLVFGYDGHGSTRLLLDLAGALATVAGVRQVFDYDAYGNLRNLAAAQAATALLYSGEWLDSRIGRQNLRARWYNPATGRFDSRDPVFGNLQDPQSLHKYLYTHADPVNGIDPSGEFVISLSIGLLLNSSIRIPNAARIVLVGGFAVGIVVDSLSVITLGQYIYNGFSTPTGKNVPLTTYGRVRAYNSTFSPRQSVVTSLGTPAAGVNPKPLAWPTPMQVLGGDNKRVFRSTLPANQLFGPAGCAPCVSVLFVTPQELIGIHFNPGFDSPRRTLARVGPFPPETRAVLAGATQDSDRQFSEFAIDEILRWIEADPNITLEGFHDSANIFADKDGNFYDF